MRCGREQIDTTTQVRLHGLQLCESTDEDRFYISHPLPVVMHVNLLWNFNGFHLHVRVVGLEILFSEVIAVVQQEGTAPQLHCVTQLEVCG